MTNEEAIEILKEIEYPVNGDNKKCRDRAFDMAINALEQEPFMNKPCVANRVCHEDKVKVLDNIRAEISCHIIEDDTSGNTPARLRADWAAANKAHLIDIAILDKYKRESENKKWQVDKKIELLRKTHFVEDEYGYTDKELVDKVNELIEQVNKLSTKKEEEK